VGTDDPAVAGIISLMETGAGVDTISIVGVIGITADLQPVFQNLLDALGRRVTVMAGIGVAGMLSDNTAWFRTPSGGNVEISIADVGQGVDIAQIAAAVAVLESASGADTATIQALVDLAEAASGVDQAAIAAAIAAAESGAGVDAPTLATLVALQDAAIGEDQAAIVAALEVIEAGAGVDSPAIQALITLIEAATGTDQVAVSTVIAIAETALGSDAPGVVALTDVQETGQGAETISVAVLLAVIESAVGADGITVLGNQQFLDLRFDFNLMAGTTLESLLGGEADELLSSADATEQFIQ